MRRTTRSAEYKVSMEANGIEHAWPECTGEWRLSGGAGRRRLTCDGCKIEHPVTPGRRRAAADENIAGSYLRRLAGEGSSALDADRDAA